MRASLFLVLLLSACSPAVATEVEDTATTGPLPTLVAEVMPLRPVVTTYPTPPMAHLRCTALYDITDPDGALIGSWCAFGIRTNGVDRTCLVAADGTGMLVCL